MKNLPIDVHKSWVHNTKLLILSAQIQWELLVKFLVHLDLVLFFILIFIGIVNLLHSVKIVNLEDLADCLLLGSIDSKVC